VALIALFLQAFHATLEDWVDGIESWPRFWMWVLTFAALGCIPCFVF
jgi:hypothetical protein